MDLAAVRTVVAVAETGQFLQAAAELSITQQAVSKRIAALERELGVRLFTRTARGAQLTGEGAAFLPHARQLLEAERRAVASVRPGGRPLRVDMIGSRLAPADLMRAFHQAHPEIGLELVTMFDAASAIAAIRSGAIDASFRAVAGTARELPEGIAAVRVHDEPHRLITGPGHALAGAGAVTPAELAGHPIWIPGLVTGTEWTAYYAALGEEFGITIAANGPNFGTEAMLAAIADSPTLATLVGVGTRMSGAADYDVRHIAVHHPSPVYPHSLLWRADDPHPALATLRAHLAAGRAAPDPDVWVPRWARG